jgi:hypothetical protein
MDISELRQSVESEIASYTYSVHKEALGQPMSKEWVSAQLKEMLGALVDPAWRTIAIRDSVEQARGEAEPELRQCVIVADDQEGYELYYDPLAQEFVLAYSGNPPTTFNVRGDAVGCFMAR